MFHCSVGNCNMQSIQSLNCHAALCIHLHRIAPVQVIKHLSLKVLSWLRIHKNCKGCNIKVSSTVRHLIWYSCIIMYFIQCRLFYDLKLQYLAMFVSSALESSDLGYAILLPLKVTPWITIQWYFSWVHHGIRVVLTKTEYTPRFSRIILLQHYLKHGAFLSKLTAQIFTTNTSIIWWIRLW